MTKTSDTSDILLQTRDLTKRFGGVVAVDGVNFMLREGEVHSLIGPNGAGKTTFFKLLTGLRPSAGEIIYRGRSIAGLMPHEIARQGIGIKKQVPSVFDGLTVEESLMVAALRTRSRRTATAEVAATIDRLKLGEIAGKQVGILAHGQRQWVEIGMVLAQGCGLILLDEPAAGMTSEEVVRTVELIRDINRDRTIIVVEHDMKFIRMISHRVTVFHQGRILAAGTPDDVLSDHRVKDIYIGNSAA